MADGHMLQELAIIAAALGLAVKMFADFAVKLGWISGGPVASAASERADRAEHELQLAHVRASEQETRIASLEKRTDLRPLLDLVERGAGLQQQTLDKLGDLNGGLRAATAGLDTTNVALIQTTEAIKFAASQLIQKGTP